MSEPDEKPRWAGTAGGFDERGKFTRGNTLGTGNPRAKHHAELRKAFRDCGTEDDVRAFYAKLRELALDGDVTALKLLLDHLIGRPIQALEISGADEAVKVDMQGLTAVILGALSDLPEARVKVAAALRASRLAQLEGNGDGSSDVARNPVRSLADHADGRARS